MKNSRWIMTLLGLVASAGAIACSASPSDQNDPAADGEDNAELRTKVCGGIAGIQCPSGYACEITAHHPDASGTCKKVKRCGGIAGLQCPNGYSCELDGNYPDAMGTCTKQAPAPQIEDFQDCTTDSDCKRVPAEMCCPNGTYAAIAKNKVTSYQNADWCPQKPTACPLAMRLDQRVAQCNTGKGKCEMIAIEDIACGGFTRNPHHCPTGYDCDLSHHVADIPGSCVASAP